jgi:hypothetical protein
MSFPETGIRMMVVVVEVKGAIVIESETLDVIEEASALVTMKDFVIA